jgi:hypothetical protein
MVDGKKVDEEKVVHILRYIKIYHTTGISYVNCGGYNKYYPVPEFKRQYDKEIKQTLKPVEAIIMYENGNYVKEQEEFMGKYRTNIKDQISYKIEENCKKKKDRFNSGYPNNDEDLDFEACHGIKDRGGELTTLNDVYKMYIVDKRFLTLGRYY